MEDECLDDCYDMMNLRAVRIIIAKVAIALPNFRALFSTYSISLMLALLYESKIYPGHTGHLVVLQHSLSDFNQ